MTSSNDQVRLNVDIPYKLSKRFDAVPWGFKSQITRKLVEQFCDRLEKDGSIVIYQLLQGEFNPTNELTK